MVEVSTSDSTLRFSSNETSFDAEDVRRLFALMKECESEMNGAGAEMGENLEEVLEGEEMVEEEVAEIVDQDKFEADPNSAAEGDES